ncbi:MAG: porin [Desulfuromonadales bacterium]
MKLLKVLVAVLVMAAMAVPVIAEDRLQLSGEMRVRAFHTDNDFDGDTDNGTDTWANQRLRIAGNIAVAEGVSVTFRTDITEGTNWGDSSSFGAGPGNPERTNGFGHARSGSQQQWDRAHLDITKGMFHLRAGQQFIGTGGTWALDTQDSGLSLDIKAGVPFNVFFIVDKDGGSLSAQDAYLYGASLSPKGDNFAAKLFGVGYSDAALGTEVYLVGLSASTNLSIVKLFGEVDYFTGDHSDTVDAQGAQVFLDASVAATDAITVGLQGFYANGDDEDRQYVRLGNGFNGWDPIMDVGTSLSNEEIVLGNPFDFTGTGAGVMAGRLYTSFKASDALMFGLSGAYLETEDDDVADVDAWAFAGGVTYTLLKNTSLQLQLQYTDGTENGSGSDPDVDFDSFAAGTGIFVSF